MIERALISVSDKTNLKDLTKALTQLNVEIISTTGTAEKIKSFNIPVKDVKEITNFPEILDGRVKTLHPKIYGGILSLRNEKHEKTTKKFGIDRIDMVVVNLYPFSKFAKSKKSKIEILEHIDIGGPALLRAAAKNYRNVLVITDPNDYNEIIDKLKNKGNLDRNKRKQLAKKAFQHTAYYDSMVCDYFQETEEFPDQLARGWKKGFETRYGENWHQQAGFYKHPLSSKPSISNAKKLHGKKISFNNLNDANAAIELIKEFDGPAVAIFKHTNPCGVSVKENLSKAFDKALASDKKSAFGGVIALNKTCNLETSKKITSFFNEVVIAPSYDKQALKQLKTKKDLRVLKVKNLDKISPSPGLDLKHLENGVLAQLKNVHNLTEKDLKIATKIKPTKTQTEDMLFGWKVVKHVKSNAILLVKNKATIGVGAGQMSRIDSVELAIKKAKGKAGNSVLVSDGFFPFRDSIDKANKFGIKAIIQPGGSIHDEQVIEAANEHQIPMVFTGYRAFSH